MAPIRIESINDDIAMIDFELYGIRRIGAIYLIEGTRTCMIDAGPKASSKRIIKALDSAQAFPPDVIILTHSHWDHTQGASTFCREAQKRGKQITVMASEKAIPNLEDQSWNRVLNAKQKYEDIVDVEPLKSGQIVDIGGLEIEIIDFSGHCADDIALYDAKNKTVFLGDALGYRFENDLFFPPFMPPFWNKDGFYAAAEKLKTIDYERICLAHYGCIDGKDAQDFPTESVAAMETWWDVFADADDKGMLDDPKYMRTAVLQETGIVLPEVEIANVRMKAILSFTNAIRKVLGKKPIDVAEVQLETFIGDLVKGYRGATA